MKQLISTKEVRDAANQKQKVICLAKEHIVTPSAKDLAKELGIQFVLESENLPEQLQSVTSTSDASSDLPKHSNDDLDVELICMIVMEVLKQLRKKVDW